LAVSVPLSVTLTVVVNLFLFVGAWVDHPVDRRLTGRLGFVP
jgi:hypothetical protein